LSRTIFDQGIGRQRDTGTRFERRGKPLPDAIDAAPQRALTEACDGGKLMRPNVSEILGSPPLAAIILRGRNKSLNNRKAGCSFEWRDAIDENLLR
jgi:hypothetical protein